MNAKISVFAIYIVLKRSTYNLHDCTFKSQQKFSHAYLKSLASQMYTSKSFQDDWSQINSWLVTSFFQFKNRQGRLVFMKSGGRDVYIIFV